MAQYYQLTSLEEICHVYPNLQVDNIDSVQYMVQDEKIIQYTDSQVLINFKIVKILAFYIQWCNVICCSIFRVSKF